MDLRTVVRKVITLTTCSKFALLLTITQLGKEKSQQLVIGKREQMQSRLVNNVHIVYFPRTSVTTRSFRRFVRFFEKKTISFSESIFQIRTFAESLSHFRRILCGLMD